MADRNKDKQQLRLEALFQSDPLPDLGFSKKVMRRVRRQMWIRRLAMPVAVSVGGLFAARPASEIVVSLVNMVAELPLDRLDISAIVPALPMDSIPQFSTLLVSGVFALVALFFVRALAD